MNEKILILAALGGAILYRSAAKQPKLFSTMLAAGAGALAASLISKKK